MSGGSAQVQTSVALAAGKPPIKTVSIALRGVGLGLGRKDTSGQPILNADTLAWAQANLQAAWNIRNSDNVMWNDWVDSIPGNYTYHSWDCSSAVAGMLDIAAPN